MAEPTTQDWLDLELERVWLLAERRLRRLQVAGAAIANPRALTHLEAVLSARHRRRGAAEAAGPPGFEALSALVARNADQLAVARPVAPLGALAVRLGLRGLEVDLIAVVLAPLIDPPLGELIHLVRGGSPRRGVDLALAAELLELDRRRRVELLAAIDADRPLVRWGIVSIEPGGDGTLLTQRALQLVPDVVATLCGARELPPGLVATCQLRAPGPSLDPLLLTPELRASVQALQRHHAAAPARAPWVVLWGPPGAGRRELAARIAAPRGPTLTFDPSACTRDELSARLHAAQRHALVRGAALAVGPIDAEQVAALAAALRRYPGELYLAVTASEPVRLEVDHPVVELRLEPLATDDARTLWQRALAGAPGADALELASVVEGFRLTPGDVHAAARAAIASARGAGRALVIADVRHGIEQRLRAQLGGIVQRVEAQHAWDDLVLPDADLDRLRELVDRRRHASLVYDRWGLGQRVRYGKGMIALLSGPPGTGKTMIAGVVARELQLELYQVDLSQVVSKWAGETEKQLGRVFDLAERTQAVLLFDEADSLFGKRGEVNDARDRYANLTVNYLLQRLERYPGVAILTTNKEAALDDALQRRLGLHLRLELPEPAERARLWRSFLGPGLPGGATIDVAWLAERFELAGGTIKNAAVRAAFLAAGEAHDLDLAVVVTAIERELDDMGRVVWQTAAPAAHAVDVSDVILD